MIRPEQITLRPATAADDDFLLSVYSSTRAEELNRVPWTAEQKEAFVKMQFAPPKQHYAATFPQASHDVIYLDETAAGKMYPVPGAEAVHIPDITVPPPYPNPG